MDEIRSTVMQYAWEQMEEAVRHDQERDADILGLEIIYAGAIRVRGPMVFFHVALIDLREGALEPAKFVWVTRLPFPTREGNLVGLVESWDVP